MFIRPKRSHGDRGLGNGSFPPTRISIRPVQSRIVLRTENLLPLPSTYSLRVRYTVRRYKSRLGPLLVKPDKFGGETQKGSPRWFPRTATVINIARQIELRTCQRCWHRRSVMFLMLCGPLDPIDEEPRKDVGSPEAGETLAR